MPTATARPGPTDFEKWVQQCRLSAREDIIAELRIRLEGLQQSNAALRLERDVYLQALTQVQDEPHAEPQTETGWPRRRQR